MDIQHRGQHRQQMEVILTSLTQSPVISLRKLSCLKKEKSVLTLVIYTLPLNFFSLNESPLGNDMHSVIY